MARSASDQPPPREPESEPDALSVLARDHQLVEELFAEFQRSAPQQLDPLARRICKMLRVHTQIEEELFYPTARRALENDALIDGAEREHAEARDSIARVESMTSDHPQFRSAVEALCQQVTRHMCAEEQELFEQLRNSKLDLLALGIALAERRDTLLEVLGLHGDDEEGAANQRETHPAASAEKRPRS
jgi:hemerythrin superfamily protein